jgi:hypothetical protein
MKEVFSAVNNKVRGDAILMGRIGGKGPYYGRLPVNSPHTKMVGAITMEGESVTEPGGKEAQFIVMHLWAFKKTLVEDMSSDLDRLFMSWRFRWVPLTPMPANMIAFTRIEFRFDVVDPGSELFHKVVRIRVRFGQNSN